MSHGARNAGATGDDIAPHRTAPNTPAWGDPTNGRFFRMRNGRLTGYWATLGPARLQPEDFWKTFP